MANSDRQSLSPGPDGKTASVSKLATRNPRLYWLCDPGEAQETKIESKFLGWIVSESETAGGTARNPMPNPMASAAIPAEIKRDGGRSHAPTPRPSGLAMCSLTPRTRIPRLRRANKQSNCGKEWSGRGHSCGKRGLLHDYGLAAASVRVLVRRPPARGGPFAAPGIRKTLHRLGLMPATDERRRGRRVPKADVALSVPALAVVTVAPAALAGAAPPMTEGRPPAARGEAVPSMTEERVAAAGQACARWGQRPAEAPISGAGCPARPSPAWRCREPTAPGRRRAARHFAAPRRGPASSSPTAETRERRRWAPATRQPPMPSAPRLRLARMLPAAPTPAAARTPERQAGSAPRRQSRGRTAGRSLAATTTNQAAEPSSRSSPWPCRRRTARSRWPRHQCMPSPGSGRCCARVACRAKAGRSATGRRSGQLAEAWRRTAARLGAAQRKSRISPWGDADRKRRARAWTELLRRRSSPSVPARRHRHRGADLLALGSALYPFGRPVSSHLNPPPRVLEHRPLRCDQSMAAGCRAEAGRSRSRSPKHINHRPRLDRPLPGQTKLRRRLARPTHEKSNAIALRACARATARPCVP